MLEEYLKNLVTIYVSPEMIKSMVTVLFITSACSLMLVILSVGFFCMNLASLVDRILPAKSKESTRSSARFSLRDLAFWKKKSPTVSTVE